MNIIDYEETKQQGSPDFPIEYYFVDHRHIRYVMQLHWHKEFELIRVLAGKLRVFLNNEEYLAQTGDIIFVSGHTLTRAEPENCVYECIVFDLNMIRGFHQGKAAGFPVVAIRDAWEPLQDEVKALADVYVLSYSEMDKIITE